MGHWVKYFISGGKEVGSDSDIKQGKASWSKGYLTGIYGVELFHNNTSLSITGPGEYWQSDTYEMSLFENVPVLINRRIERKITASDFFYTCSYKNKIFTLTLSNGSTGNSAQVIHLHKNQIGCWLIAEMNVRNDSVIHYISKERV